MVVARCAHADCGRFVKADETWCAKHAPKVCDCGFAGTVDDAIDGHECPVVGRWTFDRHQALPHHADQTGNPDAQIAASRDYIERTYGRPADAMAAALYNAEAIGLRGVASLAVLRDAADNAAELPAYPDAANELARGKHRVKDKPCKRRWWQRKDNR